MQIRARAEKLRNLRAVLTKRKKAAGEQQSKSQFDASDLLLQRQTSAGYNVLSKLKRILYELADHTFVITKHTY